jgi:hypothetical protein
VRGGKFLAAAAHVFNIRPSVSDPDGTKPEHTPFQKHRRLGRILINCAAFFGALVLCSAAAAPWLPFPPVGGPYQKWLYFQAHRETIDVLFLGSSRFHRQIIPARFDSKVEELSGMKLRSFNFGIDGMWPPESFWVLRRILESRPPALRWVVLEGIGIDTRLDANTAGSHRHAYWHDWQHTVIAWQSILEMRISAMEKAPMLWGHAWHFAAVSLHCGRGAEWIAHEVTSEPRRRESRWKPPGSWRDFEGFEPMKDASLSADDRATFLTLVQKRRSGTWPSGDTASLVCALRDVLADIKAAGASPIVVIPPSVLRRETASAFEREIPIWRFLNPDEYSALYDPGIYADSAHLNSKGAELFTDLLAAKFAGMLSSSQ